MRCGKVKVLNDLGVGTPRLEANWYSNMINTVLCLSIAVCPGIRFSLMDASGTGQEQRKLLEQCSGVVGVDRGRKTMRLYSTAIVGPCIRIRENKKMLRINVVLKDGCSLVPPLVAGLLRMS